MHHAAILDETPLSKVKTFINFYRLEQERHDNTNLNWTYAFVAQPPQYVIFLLQLLLLILQ